MSGRWPSGSVGDNDGIERSVAMKSVVRWTVAFVVVFHGLIHLMGAAEGFGWVSGAELREPIGGLGGVTWLAAAVLVVTAGGMLAVEAPSWWAVTAAGAVVSQGVVIAWWDDAGAGTAANVLMLLAAAYGYASQGPRSFRAEYQRRMDAALSESAGAARPGEVVTEADLARLPAPVAEYVRRSGAVGAERVVNSRGTFRGRIRSGPGAPWMTLVGEQFNTYGARPRRLFRLDAVRFGLPADVLHVFEDGGASMRAKVLSVVPVLDAAGPDMDRGETVTVFNDLCLLAPAALVDAPVLWQLVDERHVRGTFTCGSQTVSAVLVFDDDGDLVDFISDDRLRASADGRTFTRQRWSTPVQAYAVFGRRRAMAHGEARWHAPEPEGEFAYFEYSLDHITYNTGIVGTSRTGDAVGAR
jgi:hypothetical protein